MALQSGFTSFSEDPFFESYSKKIAEFPTVTPFQWLRDVPVQTNKSLGVEGPKSGQFLPFKQQEEFHNLTSHVDHLMGRINSMTERMMLLPIEQQNIDGHTYMESSAYAYRHSQTGGSPLVYEAHHSRRTAPGGVSEEKKALRDASKNCETMSITRQILNRGHMTKRMVQGDRDEVSQSEKVYGMNEQQLDQFKRDWETVTGTFMPWYYIDSVPDHNTIKWAEPLEHSPDQ